MEKDYSVLDYIWSKQKEFNKNFVDFEYLSDQKRQGMTKEYVLHLLSESHSLLEEVNWKMHHKSTLEVNRRDLMLEWIDVFKYWLSIGLLWDFSPQDFVTAFEEKSDLVEQRFLQEFHVNDGRPVAVCDIDGLLGDYPYSFLKFVEDCTGNPRGIMSDQEISDLDLYKAFNEEVPSGLLKHLKHEYRQSGLIREEGVVEGAQDFLEGLRGAGYYVVLLTSRPFDRYKNLYLDTYIWLKNNNLRFDMLLSDSKKRDKITKLSETSEIAFVADDDPKIIQGLLGLDKLHKIYMMDRSYNQSVNFSDSKVVRVKDFNEILVNEGVVK